MSYKCYEALARLGGLEIHVEIDRILTALELVSDLYTEELVTYHTHQVALQAGQPTQDLLSPWDIGFNITVPLPLLRHPLQTVKSVSNKKKPHCNL